ncbi:hypothetical protein ASZ78_008572 [Callipepla squamata]|uniref:Purinergic receptor n=1 Tax=Callipepla squamata TaxID=9009 RepID=A0A226NEC7_CALSU|nr:hypothetical protein ASZ78_008572 [Callipepla squamata]
MATELCGALLDYKTEKFALTRNRRVGLLHRLLQLAVLGYVLGWVFAVRRGYQDTDAAPHVSVVTKLKGASVSRAEDARRRLWDAADFARPPQGENVLFLVTNFIVTDKQAQGTCPEVSRCNTLQTNDPTYFKTCVYNPFFSPSCPVFRIRDMVEAAGETFGDLALLPRYSFILLDRSYNFRTASYYWDSQRRHYRSLLKLYGIRFDISVHGQAGKFGIIPAAVSFGTGIAFLGTATMICDLVLLYLDTKADLYWKEKYEEVRVG